MLSHILRIPIFIALLLIFTPTRLNAFTCNNIDSTDPAVCSSHGHCIAQDKCICHQGYHNGAYCEGFLPLKRPSVELYGLGDNSAGQLQANGAIATSWSSLNATTSLSTDEIVRFAMAGRFQNFAATSDMRVFGWGSASRIGTGASENQISPQLLTDTDIAKTIIYLCSSDHTIAVTANNDLIGWGANTQFQVHSSGVDLTTPTPMSKGAMGTKLITGVACGNYISLFLTSDGAVYSQGSNVGGDYYLGLTSAVGSPTYAQTTPARIANLDAKTVYLITAGDSLSHVVTVDNEIYAWGEGWYLGTGDENPKNLPTLIDHTNLGGVVVKQICDGQTHGLLLTEAGKVYGWGFSLSGSVGNGESLSAAIPVELAGSIAGKFVSSISCHKSVSIAVTSDGMVHEWGRSVRNTGNRNTPTALSMLVNGESLLDSLYVSRVTAGNLHLLLEMYRIPVCYGVKEGVAACNSQGTCQGDNVCICSTGYAGLECELNVCFGYLSNDTANVCSVHGTCSAPNVCDCITGYDGAQCELNVCFGYLSNDTANVCTGRGSCVAPDMCTCSEGYDGAQCELSECFGYLSNDTANVCTGRGSCDAPNQCTCNSSYSGEQCTDILCFGFWSNNTNVCSSYGECIAPNTCNCSTGYHGNQCELVECFGLLSNDTDNVCSGQGTCSAPDTCTCFEGYGSTACEHFVCFDYLSNDTSRVCSGNGNCTGPGICECVSTYGGASCALPYCFGHLSNETTFVCSGWGDCIAPDSCVCHDTFHGSQCEIYECFGVMKNSSAVCSALGNCTAPQQCTCNTGYYGDECNIPQCFGHFSNDTQQVCSGNGNCTAYNVCECSSGWFGDSCSLTTCFNITSSNSSVCSGRGSCVGPDECTCEHRFGGEQCNECSSSYHGTNCSLPVCFNSVQLNVTECSGHGTCVDVDECSCDFGYLSDECDASTWCFGYRSYDRNVCFGRGTCTAFDTCECESGSSGSECENFSCFGLNNVDSLACSSHGYCVASNECLCLPGYSGPECDKYECFGVVASDPSVCSYSGTCTGPNECTCNALASGSDCSNFNCFGVPASESSIVCGGHGTCTAADTCVCSDTFSGSACATPKCNGTLSTDASVCSSHGLCAVDSTTGEPACTCTDGYSGANCDALVCTGSINDTCLVHGSCASIGAPCVCDASTTKGFWQGDACTQCATFYYGDSCTQFCNPATTCTSGVCDTSTGECVASQVTDFTFNSNLDALVGTYSYRQRSTQIAGTTSNHQHIDCSTILSSASLAAVGGTYARCTWPSKDSDEFQIILGYRPSILPGDTLTWNLKPGSTTQQKTVGVIQPTASSNVPVARLLAPNSVGSCDPIVLDGSASSSTDRRSLQYEWKIVEGSNLAAIQTLLSASSSSAVVLIPASSLSGSYYVFSLKVIDFLNRESTVVEAYVARASVGSGPVVSLDSSWTQKIHYSRPIVLRGTVGATSCFTPSTTLVYTWTQRSGPVLPQFASLQRDGAFLSLPSGFFPLLNATYQFQLTVSAPLSAVPTRIRIFVETFHHELVPIIRGGTSRIISASSTLTLDASLSYDPEHTADSESFSWSCFNSQTKLACTGTAASLPSTATISLAAGSLSTGEYTFRVRYSKSDRSATASVSVTVTSSNVPIVQISPEKGIFSQDVSNLIRLFGLISSSSSVSLQWSSPSLSSLGAVVKSGALTHRNLVILGNSLLPGSTSTFKLSATSITGTGASSVDIYSKIPPPPGHFSVSPTTGFAFVTKFVLSCANWQSTGLLYVYSFVHPLWNVEVPLGSMQFESSLTRQIPVYGRPASGYSVTIIARVHDFESNATTSITSALTIRPRNDGAVVDTIISTMQTQTLATIDRYIAALRFNDALYEIILSLEAMNDDTEATSTSCLRDCSGNGQCSIDTLTCMCNDGFFGDDCRLTETQLTSRKLLRASLLSQIIQVTESRFDDDYRVAQRVLAIEALARRRLELNAETVHDLSLHALSFAQKFYTQIVSTDLLSLFVSALSNVAEVMPNLLPATVAATDSSPERSLQQYIVATAVYDTLQLLSKRSVHMMNSGDDSTSIVNRNIMMSSYVDQVTGIQSANLSFSNDLSRRFEMTMPADFSPSTVDSASDVSLRAIYWAFNPFTDYTLSKSASIDTTVAQQIVADTVLSVEFDTIPDVALRESMQTLEVDNLSSSFNFTLVGNFSALTNVTVDSAVSTATLYCAHWNKATQEWSSEGCTLLTYSYEFVQCSCTHATDFSLLLDIDLVESVGTFSYMSLVYAGISVVFLAIIVLLLCLLCMCCCILCCTLCSLRNSLRRKQRRLRVIKNLEITGEDITYGYITGMRAKAYEYKDQGLDDTSTQISSTISTLSVDAASEISIEASKYFEMDFVEEYRDALDASSDLGSSNDGKLEGSYMEQRAISRASDYSLDREKALVTPSRLHHLNEGLLKEHDIDLEESDDSEGGDDSVFED